jgi:phage tail sheath gpL-like
MAIAFNNIPSNLRVPLFYAEINAGVSPYQAQSRTLLIGRTAVGFTAVMDQPVRIDRDPAGMFGPGSELADMAVWARANNPFGEIWAGPIADAGVKQTWTITVGALSANQGILSLYVAGERLLIPVTAADTPTTVAAAIATAIGNGYTKFNRPMSFPVTAVPAVGVVTVTARNGGLPSADIDISKDIVGDEDPVLAAKITIAKVTPGTGAAGITTLLANLGDTEFDWICIPDSDTTTLDTLRDFLGDVSGRWSPLKQLYGHAITAKFGTLSALATFGSGRNNPNESIMGVINSPSSPARWAAAIGGVVGSKLNLGAELSGAIEISRPTQTLPLTGIMGPKIRGDAWDITELNTLYQDGISGFYVQIDGTVRISRTLTTYQVNVWSQPDITWLDINTRAQMVYTVRYLRQQLTATYPRHALADDNPNALQGMTTPKEIKATVIHLYNELVGAGIAEKPDVFATGLIVERSSDPNRINIYLPVDVVNQLRILAVNATTFLETQAVAA